MSRIRSKKDWYGSFIAFGVLFGEDEDDCILGCVFLLVFVLLQVFFFFWLHVETFLSGFRVSKLNVFQRVRIEL